MSMQLTMTLGRSMIPLRLLTNRSIGLFARSNSKTQQRFRSSAVINGHSSAVGAPTVHVHDETQSSSFPKATTATITDNGKDKSASSAATIQGEVLDLAADLRTFRAGDKLEIPYELTVSESMQDFWHSVRTVATVDTT